MTFLYWIKFWIKYWKNKAFTIHQMYLCIIRKTPKPSHSAVLPVPCGSLWRGAPWTMVILPLCYIFYNHSITTSSPTFLVHFMLNITKLSYLILFAILSLYTVYHSLNDVAHNNVDFYGLTVFEYSNENSTKSETELKFVRLP